MSNDEAAFDGEDTLLAGKVDNAYKALDLKGLEGTADINTATTAAKCAHDACKCMVAPNGQYGKYCSEHCQDNGDLIELRCDCGHPGCA